MILEWLNYATPLLITLALAYALKRVKASDAEQEAVGALLEGMAKAEDELVREAKRAAEDGKLTPEEIAKARNIAVEHAKSVAYGPAKNLILSWSGEKVAALIKANLK